MTYKVVFLPIPSDGDGKSDKANIRHGELTLIGPSSAKLRFVQWHS